MKVVELLALLATIPLDANIFIESGDDEMAHDIQLEPLTESHDDPTIIGYMLVPQLQMKLDFDKDVN